MGVAPLAGAWIEIPYGVLRPAYHPSLPSRERGLKSNDCITKISYCSRSPRGSVDWNVKEEKFLTVLSALFEKYEPNFYKNIPACREEVEKACRFMEENLSEHISLEEISRYAGLSKSTLLRAFAKEKGITPYRYLETIRIHQAKQMLGELSLIHIWRCRRS